VSTELYDERKKRGIKRLINSFKYSIAGLKHAYTKEQSMAIHIIIALLVIGTGFFFKIDNTEWLFVILLIGFVIATELINTAIEATVDLLSPGKNGFAKIAKDTAAAAVFVLSLVAFVGGLIIFIPKIIEKFF